MEEIVKHINDTNASYRTPNAGDAKNTDLFLDNEHFELFKNEGENIRVRFSKENLSKAILFIASILPRKYDNSSAHKSVDYSAEFVYEQLRMLDGYFMEEGKPVDYKIQTWNARKNVQKKNGEIDNRFYFNGLREKFWYKDSAGNIISSIFTIRNYLAGGYSDLHIKKIENDFFDVWVTNSVQPYSTEKNIGNDNLPSSGTNPLPIQQITYGAPGTGKSFSIDEDVKRYGMKDIRTTFHPDSDYSTFVGAYKPQMEKVVVRDDRGFPVKEEGKVVYEKKIVYKYSQQAFLKAYTTAWKDLKTPHVLVIEEINRGNCAQIFGDLFQLLDRNESGFSSYPITPDTDIMQVLNEEFEGLELESSESINAQYKEDVVEDVLAGNKLLLPNNLYIWATMNTSDQSLFPIDSAFKRRWDWKYVPISDAGKQWVIRVNDTDYSWWSFLDKVNFKIWDATHSEDKKLGYFFCKADKDGVITAEKFVGKVLFYIYNDVFKDYGFDDDIFKDVNDKENPDLMFKDFFLSDGTPCENKIQVLLNNLEVVAVLSSTNENHASEEATENNLSTEDEYNEEPLLNDQNETSGNDYTKYSFDGNHHLGKGDLAVKIVERFTRENPDITFDQLKQEFPDTMMGDKLKLLGLIVKAKDLENAPYSYQKKAYGFFKKGRKYTSGDGIEYCVSNYWNITNIQSIIDYAVEKGWDVTTEN